MKRPTLVLADELAVYMPDRFVSPKLMELESLCVGMCVKVRTSPLGPGSEAFWVELDENKGNTLAGRIVNHLQNTQHHGLAAFGRISLRRECVLAIAD